MENDLVLEHLKRIQASLSNLTTAMGEVRTRLSMIEQSVAAMNHRMDNLSTRIERIEQRLELVDT